MAELLLGLALLLSLLGAVFKLMAWLEGSMAALVDAATCFASLAAGMVSVWAQLASRRPPDEEHPYGHERYLLYGSIVIAVLYSIVLGISVDRLAERLANPYYHVAPAAPLYVAIGMGFYVAAVAAARRAGFVGRTYAAFLSSEIIEGFVTIASSAVGAAWSSIADYLGGWLLVGYLAYEIFSELRSYEAMLTDMAEPMLAERLRRMLEQHGLRVKSLRIRLVMPGRYHGDAVVEAPKPLEEAHDLIDEVAKEARDRMGVELVIHYEPGKEAQGFKPAAEPTRPGTRHAEGGKEPGRVH
ncbi:MAG: cation transporter [Crenarchaeota archaeon]|nr:cation transporter [Thermoproteota archaeon]